MRKRKPRRIKHIVPVIPKGHHVRGVSTLVNKHGQIVGQWQKSAKTRIDPEVLVRELRRALPKLIKAPPRSRMRPPRLDASADDLLAVYPIGDPHLGLLTWAPETGEDWDLKIADRVMRGAIDAIVEHGPAARECLILELGDLTHADNASNRTSRAGHALDVDGRRFKILRMMRDLLIHYVVCALTRHEIVNVRIISGNHDDETSMFAVLLLEAYFRNQPRVRVHVDPAQRQYMRFGANLIGMVHGHEARGNPLAQIMPAERPQDWGETRHRTWLCGHVHHRSVREHPGVVIETFRTLAPRDAWAAGEGYLAERDLSRIVYHRDRGEISRSRIAADALREQVSK